MLPRVSRETEIVRDASPSRSKEMEVEPSILNVAANQCKSSCDVGLFLMRDAPIDECQVPDSFETLDSSSLLHLPYFNVKKS
jgi:hypothetical protein